MASLEVESCQARQSLRDISGHLSLPRIVPLICIELDNPHSLLQNPRTDLIWRHSIPELLPSCRDLPGNIDFLLGSAPSPAPTSGAVRNPVAPPPATPPPQPPSTPAAEVTIRLVNGPGLNRLSPNPTATTTPAAVSAAEPTPAVTVPPAVTPAGAPAPATAEAPPPPSEVQIRGVEGPRRPSPPSAASTANTGPESP